MDYLPDKPMTCYQAQLTMALHMKDDPGLTTKRRQAFEAHLRSCPKCAQDYEETKWVMGLVVEYWSEKPENKAILERAKQPVKPKMTVEEGLQDLLRRCPDLAEGLKHQKRMRFIRRVGAFAACLILALLTWMTFSIHPRINQRPHISEPLVPQQVASLVNSTVKIELFAGADKVIVPAGQEILTSADEQKTLIINDRHRMTMNANTSLSIEVLTDNSHVGCMVKLASGEIFTHVEHDGNPFIVGTPYGQAVITGTTFDVKVTDDSTALVVTEGTVKFKSEKGLVNVGAGQLSEIVNRLAPTRPTTCNAKKLTAWATGYKPAPALAQAESNGQWEPTLPSLRQEPIVLEETDYDHWVEQNRDWFKREFPQVFQLQSALAKEGIDVDYPDLLIKTGDAWQFVCLDVSPARFSVIDPNSLIKTASNYGFDKQWLLENVTAAKYALEKPVLLKNGLTALIAFEQWNNSFEDAQKSSDLVGYDDLYSLFYASVYLAETRSLIWFAVRDGRYDLTDKERTEVLALLQKEVTVACEYKNDEMCFTDEQEKPSCDGDTFKTADEKIIGYIEIMKTIEERIAEYELGK